MRGMVFYTMPLKEKKMKITGIVEVDQWKEYVAGLLITHCIKHQSEFLADLYPDMIEIHKAKAPCTILYGVSSIHSQVYIRQDWPEVEQDKHIYFDDKYACLVFQVSHSERPGHVQITEISL